MIKVLGVDPGKNGAMAMIVDGKLLDVYAFNGDLERCRRLTYVLCDLIVIEQVSASPNMGVVSAFTFGRFFEAVVTSAVCNTSKFLLVRPQKWQEALGCLNGGNKSVTYNKAQELFPEAYKLKMFNKETSDAVLLAHYAYKHHVYNSLANKGGL